jgi:hypothetical protein
MSSRVVIKMFDEDTISDEIVGSLLFNLKECIGDKVSSFQRFNFRMEFSFGRMCMGLPWVALARLPRT